jgi:hypothetical protein
MAFYAFKLSRINVINPRARTVDNDIVTFTVLVNQLDRGRGSGFFPAMGKNSNIAAAAVNTTNRTGRMGKDWIVGPLEISPGDIIHLIYSGTNTSDGDLSQIERDKIELKILDSIVSAAVGAIGGAIGAAIGTALGYISDPVGTILGYEPYGPCNGLVFSDTIEFSGSGLATLPFRPPPPQHVQIGDVGEARLHGALEAPFTRSYTDEATHNSDNCGGIAHTDITFAVLQLPVVSLRDCAPRFFNRYLDHGVRPLAPPDSTISVRSLFFK